jgi:aspartate ammonia-lyase
MFPRKAALGRLFLCRVQDGLLIGDTLKLPLTENDMTNSTRPEHDLLGDAQVPADAYWGIHTLRAIENYPITGKVIG